MADSRETSPGKRGRLRTSRTPRIGGAFLGTPCQEMRATPGMCPGGEMLFAPSPNAASTAAASGRREKKTVNVLFGSAAASEVVGSPKSRR